MRGGGFKIRVALLLSLLVVVAYAAYRLEQRHEFRRSWEAAEEAIARRNFVEAGDHLEKCLAIRSDDPALHLLAARTARRRGDVATTLRELKAFTLNQGSATELRAEQRLLDIQQGIDRDSTEVLLDRCLSDSREPEAYLTLEVAIAANVSRLESANNSGMTLVEGPAETIRVKSERAIALWSQLRSGRADRAQGFVWRGRIRFLVDPAAGVQDFRSALELDPEHFEARLQLAAALEDYNPREAAEHLEVLRARQPQNKRVRLLLAHYRRSLGQFAEAAQILDEVLAVSPDDAAALLERGKTALDSGRSEDAAQFLRRALAAAPNEPFVHLALSRALHLSGKEGEAQRHQLRYNEIESERLRTEQIQSEQERVAWRMRVEREMLHKANVPKP